MLKKFILLFVISLIAGCGGINSSSAPSTTFVAKLDYKEVFVRAKAQAEYCWRSETEYPVTAQIDDANRVATVYVTGLLGSTRMAELVARAIDKDSTEVKIAVSGISIWNRSAVQAMKEVVEFGVPTCTSYMPVND